MNNISLSHPTQSAAGELQNRNGSSLNSPRSRRRSLLSHETAHERSLSLGELHQELENEQEAQVNRLLYMIRLQQVQLAALSTEHSQDAAPASPTDQYVSPRATASSHSAGQLGPQSLSRQSSSRFSANGASTRGTSPALRPVSANLGPPIGDFLLGGTRDEPEFYQAETQMLTRENQMLKQRIKELERQILEMSGSSHPVTAQSSMPAATSTGHDTPVAALRDG
ncbi:hypothetical protein AMS68_006399 [Peltaster fructicola]|uniref:Uncharacterized protein n=1 Tax=Peltaster fructicola TaxID=286661 RepID=A0A6H0Y1H2_9PEZI|nr:hypothetical protein AMS68_006399 [Peltaster fructicola]